MQKHDNCREAESCVTNILLSNLQQLFPVSERRLNILDAEKLCFQFQNRCRVGSANSENADPEVPHHSWDVIKGQSFLHLLPDG